MRFQETFATSTRQRRSTSAARSTPPSISRPPRVFAAHWLAPGATRELTLERRKELVRLVAASGVLPNMEVALQAAGFVGTVATALDSAAEAGQLSMCQWLWDYSRSCTEDVCEACSAYDAWMSAAYGGHQHVCEWLLTVDPGAEDLEHWAIASAFYAGHVDLAEWLLQQQRRTPSTTIDSDFQYLRGVAHGCDLPTLQRAWLRFGPPKKRNQKTTLLSSAAGSSTPDWAAKVEWLEVQGCPWSTEVAKSAASLANEGEVLARLTWLRGRGYPVDGDAVLPAASKGNMQVLE
ncbi:hypothetical protein GPECTOR_244g597 [Gonium pectorale]|uniref:Uncharacterized protein n=1 Tax=Gonium pectorale TaxID=33097 RepID=A0A150FWD3_GONPE|nr:hypothetical protein GPECTOR_244g597 [Gonium pectorale]|eukprot:KXZ41916.1 hypothetical protein GPECTOR_244g597 [Gonium pectorale]